MIRFRSSTRELDAHASLSRAQRNLHIGIQPVRKRGSEIIQAFVARARGGECCFSAWRRVPVKSHRFLGGAHGHSLGNNLLRKTFHGGGVRQDSSARA